ncbi:3-isopropylmalate dehydrogenase [Croceivirga sp. JEA036]|uniref:3-isopropylmalate dehydrogenase n=1 Tax=Croceivirga sp. JEA036 TaxID=2721162 RepID=UPI001439E274|nr:3-isopropylmalate dehydrogenase [Croceivirga sp. JEA036]NJB35825.1 3-isopropylmalate dehydrogenase [Croceivirga sp. JEA036]
MNLDIALLAGDGVGPEVTQQAVKCLEAIEEIYNHNFKFTPAIVGAQAIETYGSALPKTTLEICQNADAVLFGTVGDPKFNNNPVAQVRPEHGLIQLRKALDLYADLRPVKIFPSLVNKSPLKPEIIKGTDFIVYRELTGGIYFGEKNMNAEGTKASDVCEYTEKEISKIAHLAFKAAKNRKNKVTLIDKANVLESSKLWRKVVGTIAQSYPDVKLEYMFVDHAATELVSNPNVFDVLLTENMFGDIIADEGGVISGITNTLASAAIGDNNGLFHPLHGAYPEQKDKNIANPIAAILAAAMLLEYFKMFEEAMAIREAVNKAINLGIVTKDLDANSTYGTSHIGDFIANHIVDNDDQFNMNNENINLGRSTII